MKLRLVILTIMMAALCFVSVAAAKTKHLHHHQSHPLSVRVYAEKAAASYGWTGSEWQAIDEIVTVESRWNPCAYNPSHSDCGYMGSASCGIPQAQPCPYKWRGRMWQTRYLQVWWLMHYIKNRYGTPLDALTFRRRNGWY